MIHIRRQPKPEPRHVLFDASVSAHDPASLRELCNAARGQRPRARTRASRREHAGRVPLHFIFSAPE